MKAFLDALYDASFDATLAAYNEFSINSIHDVSYSPEFDFARRSAFNASYDAAKSQSTQSMKEAFDAADQQAKTIAYEGALGAATPAACAIISENKESNCDDLISRKGFRKRIRPSLKDSTARYVYRVSEKISFLHFLKYTQEILVRTYESSMNILIDFPEDDIFASRERWERFKNEKLKDRGRDIRDYDAYHFIKPWIDELDKLVSEMETL